MLFKSDLSWLWMLGLLTMRVAPLFLLAPGFSSGGIPARLRVLLALALAVGLLPAAGPALALGERSEESFLLSAVGELLTGLALTGGLMAAMAAFRLAGEFLDVQVGFGLANLYDPVTRSQAPLLGTALDLLAVVVFFGLDAHHAAIRALARSLQRVPLGTGLSLQHFDLLAAQFGAAFAGAIALAGPTLLALFLVDVALAVMSRTMPQMNIFVLAMPIKLFVGLGVLALSLNWMDQRVASLFDVFRGGIPSALVRP